MPTPEQADKARLTYISGELPDELHERFERRLAELRADAPSPFAHMIAGERCASGPVFQRRDPSRGAAPASAAHEADEETVQAAVRAAHGAWRAWRATPFEDRCALMRALGQAIAERRIELAAIVSLETGKVRSESIAEVEEAVDLIETYCLAIERAQGFQAPLASLVPQETNIDTLRPYGVFGVIAPFNFPLALSVNMLSAALIAGNAVVLKPSEATPWTAAALAEAVDAAGLPPGVFNLLHGGASTGRALVDAPVDGIAFTGSAEVGREIAQRLATGPYPRPTIAELGGKNPAIVTGRADLEKAAEGIARAAFGLSGQKCSSCSRAIVTADVHEQLSERLVSLLPAFVVGDPADRAATLGPVVDEAAVERYRHSVELARADGRVLGGGRVLGDVAGDRGAAQGEAGAPGASAARGRAGTPDGGCFVAPTVVDGLPSGHELTRRELFLPFVTVTAVEDLSAALEEANAVQYGLTAGIFSEDPAEVERFLDEIEAGIVYVNRRAGATTGAWPGVQSFCGWKSSGLTGKGGLGPYYVQQFMREQSRTIMS